MTVELRIGGPDHIRSGADALDMLQAAVGFYVARLGRPLAWRLRRVSVDRRADGWYARFDEMDLVQC